MRSKRLKNFVTGSIHASGVAIGCVLLCLSGGCGGCGNDKEDDSNTRIPPPVAVKRLQFGTGKVVVERELGALTKLVSGDKYTVYSVSPGEDAGKAIPVRGYIVFFADGKLAEVQVQYDTATLEREIAREDFFEKIESNYGADEDFGAKQSTRRWFNLETDVEVLWEEDFREKKGRLTVRWEKLTDQLAAARKRYREKRARERQETEDDKVDLGF